MLVVVACNNDQSSEKPMLFLPDDLEATLWAESPMFYNPTNMDVDAKGRIWVTEAVNYRNFNNDSTRARHHHQGDRVMILEDTDGDGKADASKVFVQDKDLVSPLGIAVIGNKVYVSCSPNLIVYTDADGDDKPDEKEILLTGFGGRDHDHSLHAVVGGQDGQLYFNTGNAGPHVVTDKSGWTLRSGSVYTGGSPYNTQNQGNMKSDDCKVWVGGLALRMNPAGKGLGVYAHNFRNAFELTVDSRGDLWQNDNDDQVVACRTTWLMEGGNAGFFSSDGTRYWQADQRPWQDVFTAHWHQEDPGVIPAGDNAGAGSPTGVAFIESETLGDEYLEMLLSADAGRNVVFGYHPKRKASGFDLGKRQNFITSLREDNVGYVWNDTAHNRQPDKWFRPSDVMMGTDGALYVADWYDPVVGGHQMRDTIGYGRIYRITPKGKALPKPSLDLTTFAGQLAALLSPAVNVRYTAMERLVAGGADVIPLALKLFKDEDNPFHKARAIWLLSRLGASGIAEVEKLLEHKDEEVRIVAFRALRNAGRSVLPYTEMLKSDPSPGVRREVIIALGKIPFEQARPYLLALATQYDPEDRWYLEALGTAVEGNESAFYRDLVRAFGVEAIRVDEWDKKFADLVWRLHPPEAVQPLAARAASKVLDDAERSRAITALAFINTPDAVKSMIGLTTHEHPLVSEQASYWVSFRQGNDWFALWDWRKSGIDLEYEKKVAAMKVKRNRILDAAMPMNEHRGAVREMAKDPVGAPMLLGMVAENEIPESLYPYVEEQILKNDNEAVRMQAAGYFSDKGKATKYVASDIARLNGVAARGKEVFEKQCGTCHRVKQDGRDIGPDLTAIHTKFDRQGLLTEIIRPDAGIVFGYEAWTIVLEDGRSYFGFLLADGERTVTIKDLTGKNHVVESALIKSRKKQEGSLMPSPETFGLTEQDLADITEYLMAVR